jgi:hypothetical protein
MAFFHFRVLNLRGDPENGPEPDETVLRGDREHPVLGNHGFAMRDKSLAERRRVIEGFARRIDEDAQADGLLTLLLEDLARRAAQGERFAALCWCSPLPCHLQVAAARVRQLAENPGVRSADLPSALLFVPELFEGLGPSTQRAARAAPQPTVLAHKSAPQSAGASVAGAPSASPAPDGAGSAGKTPSRAGWGRRAS